MRVLVTGGNGHLGANIVRQLLARGDTVRVLVRKDSDLRGLAGLDVEKAIGDVLDAASLEAAAEGCPVMIHTAAVYKMGVQDPALIVRPAVEGAKNAFAAAKKHGVQRIVYTSSIAAIGSRPGPEVLDETTWNTAYEDPYYEAKTESERAAHALSKETGIPMVVVCPAVIIGPHDWRTTPSTGMIRDFLKGPIYWDGGQSWVAVEDVAAVHVAAIDRGTPGERYLASGYNLTIGDTCAYLRQLTGKGASTRLPTWLLRGVAEGAELLAKVTGGKPAVSRTTVAEGVGRYQWYTNAKAQRDLGWTPLSQEETFARTIRWLVHRGELGAVGEELKAKFPPDPAWTAG
jgi:dihydroflavonol-4-reductase